ncbi:uncharacterized protein K452DRAFT_247209 [Aplosporella prunicola CBS 121167]|uniref:F-box domain-containing protein n=1 Tax=Aplosporella prunicola CBS 121167 TaxID=1176127 RepID=A0A6A6BLS2_9PEZI|nr:uncharacterized protein K452DRAFT_247209 [Aplosporella prunicola CBS 121167]KAF2143787.1 hypothetical protein K452DRAFT_247209 [Aplosporella prunicola CBS 121167]
MHSELSDVLHHASTEPTATQPEATPSQHGLESYDASLPPLLPGSGAGGQPGPEGAVDGRDTKSRLKTSPPPRNRIEEYENALAPSPLKKPELPIFEVVKKSRKPGDKSSAIAKLPNEILTHALSHLPPNDLSAVALVSHRFHDLVTTPHAWRVAFARYFPGPESLTATSDYLASDEDQDNLRSDRRAFARLTALASWRSEYILRTRLLRSLGRGKPMPLPNASTNARSGAAQVPSAIIMYNSQLYTTVNHLHATFGTGLNKRLPSFIHGADDVGMASTSEPSAGKIDNWGLSDPQLFLQFDELHRGDAMWGLGPGNIIGVPNVMDVGQPYGMVHGEGNPGGRIYYRSTEELRGRFLSLPMEMESPELGIPRLLSTTEAICSVWIAKSNTIPSLSDGLVGIMCGSSSGVITAYSLGADGLRDSRLTRGEITARWVISPGVPIIALAVDDSYSPKRQAQNRIWCVALNALGELFYLTKLPKRAPVARGARLDEPTLERMAWTTGRTVYWNEVEPSRRVARPNPYKDAELDGTYSPRSSWNGMCLNQDQIKAETREIESYLRMKPIDFRRACLGWDMRRRMEVDFAGDDGNFAGENIVVFQCGLDEEEDSTASAKRFTRLRVSTKLEVKPRLVADALETTEPMSSLFGGSEPVSAPKPPPMERLRSLSIQSSATGSPERANMAEEWRCSDLAFGGAKNVQVLTTTLDVSTYATMTLSEDPIFGFSGASNASSPFASPFSTGSQPATPADVPGQRARFVAAGTQMGSVFLWDMRAPTSKSTELTNTVDPVRIIYTDSPQISCLAMTALYLVHGGNDGLVQAWDPLASSMQPIRTLNSRFSSRARRRLVQAQASAQGVGINLFAAGAVCLDPDSTVLRGMVSLGTHLRYWSYSSSAADQYKTSKRRLRRSERGSNNGGEGPKFSASGRSKIKDYIAHEQFEMERDQLQRQRDAEHLAGRFGVDLLDDEEQALAYATLLSQESAQNDAVKRQSQSQSQSQASSVISDTPTVLATETPSSSPPTKSEEELDADIAEAIRLSLEAEANDFPSFPDEPTPTAVPDTAFDIPIRYAKSHHKASGASSSSRRTPPLGFADGFGAAAAAAVAGGSSSAGNVMDADLEYALQLSLAEEQSRAEGRRRMMDEFEDDDEDGGVGLGFVGVDDDDAAAAAVGRDEFPALGPAKGSKGKRRA